MGYCKASSTTRGKMRWRAYINVQGRQIIHTCETEAKAKKWSDTMNKKYKLIKKQPDGYNIIMRDLGRISDDNRTISLFGCRVAVSREDGDRCSEFETCPNYLGCLDEVVRKAGYGSFQRV